MATNNIKAIHPYDDPRVTHQLQVVNGKNYHYVHGTPTGSVRGTFLCLHGFPDLWYGYRFMIPFLLERGFSAIVPDMLGYGRTDAPRVPPADISTYSLKNHAADMVELLRILDVQKVILFGHDWGAVVTSRIYLYNSEIVSHIANDPQTEKDTEAPGKVRQFLKGLHRGRGGEQGDFMVDKDIVESIGDLKRSKFMTEEDLDYYTKEYGRSGFHGPLNWYKTRKVNYEDEKDLPFEGVKVPYLFLGARHDMAIRPFMAESQKHLIPHLTTRHMDTAHWALVEDPETAIGHMSEWLDSVVLGGGESKI
ncbi:alpha/beta-hydrolase [Tuber magnatum]|uniref:Alpha/beta-hydrolase n=1 Tax=Tuber magnatum TaxID=42249 RepID=A0A317T0B2_9PEZI|nr:alpha/beta-hydrolase [Tuber magnatum]